MKFAICGYGKMGKMVDEMARERGHQTVVVDPRKGGLDDLLNGVDVCIENTDSQNVLNNISLFSERKIPMVVGTTAWYDELDKASEIVNKCGNGLIYAPNFSIGVNIFLKIVKAAAELMNSFDQFDVAVFEAHHQEKKDAPSGSAKEIAQILLNQIKSKKSLVYDLSSRKRKPEEIHVSSLRVGYVPGTHEVVFDDPSNIITLSHVARDRRGFGLGAVIAAEWIVGRKGIYTLDQMIGGL